MRLHTRMACDQKVVNSLECLPDLRPLGRPGLFCKASHWLSASRQVARGAVLPPGRLLSALAPLLGSTAGGPLIGGARGALVGRPGGPRETAKDAALLGLLFGALLATPTPAGATIPVCLPWRVALPRRIPRTVLGAGDLAGVRVRLREASRERSRGDAARRLYQ